MKFGIDRLLSEPDLLKSLNGRRVALLAHPASVTADLAHSLDALVAAGVKVTAAFGPQHGLRGDKQDNMMESPDFDDPVHGIPVFSLYGEVRRPTGQSLHTFDVLLVDLQDLGCRIYTFITTLLYVIEAAAQHGKSVWVLDRPNPAGRPVEGLTLLPGWESFVGAGPIPMRHGLTLGELGKWFVDHFKLDVDYRVVEMAGYDPEVGPGFGWPTERVWINPSPNAPGLAMARAYAGTVMLEGTTLSEGRGTTRPLELFGAPDLDAGEVELAGLTHRALAHPAVALDAVEAARVTDLSIRGALVVGLATLDLLAEPGDADALSRAVGRGAAGSRLHAGVRVAAPDLLVPVLGRPDVLEAGPVGEVAEEVGDDVVVGLLAEHRPAAHAANAPWKRSFVTTSIARTLPRASAALIAASGRCRPGGG